MDLMQNGLIYRNSSIESLLIKYSVVTFREKVLKNIFFGFPFE